MRSRTQIVLLLALGLGGCTTSLHARAVTAEVADAWGVFTLALFALAFGGGLLVMILMMAGRVRPRRGGWIIASLALALFGLGAIPAVQLRSWVRSQSYEAFMAHAPGPLTGGNQAPANTVRLRFDCGPGTAEVVVDDPRHVADFFELIAQARRVSAHHSSPVRTVRFEVVGRPGQHTLAPDSDVADAYWLHLDRAPQRWPHQLHSPGLTAWLQQVGVGCPDPG